MLMGVDVLICSGPAFQSLEKRKGVTGDRTSSEAPNIGHSAGTAAHGPVVVVGDVTIPASPPVRARSHESQPTGSSHNPTTSAGPSIVRMSHL